MRTVVLIRPVMRGDVEPRRIVAELVVSPLNGLKLDVTGRGAGRNAITAGPGMTTLGDLLRLPLGGGHTAHGAWVGT